MARLARLSTVAAASFASPARHTAFPPRNVAMAMSAKNNAAIAHPGDDLSDVGTPALLLSLDAMERNCARLSAAAAAAAAAAPPGRRPAARLRPHAKAFKSSDLLKILPFERYCAQTVREAEALVWGGCGDVLLTNQVVGRRKLARLADLAASHGDAQIGVLVDCPDHVSSLGAAAAGAGATLTAYLEINAGQDRCGIDAGDGDAVVGLARAVLDAPSLRWGGLQCYHGGIQHVRSPEERRRLVLDGPVARAREAAGWLEAGGIDCPVITGGGTGTFRFELEGGVHTELQPGSFLFMDGDYGRNEDSGGDSDSAFEHSLFVHASVISSDEGGGRRVVDAGTKACDLLCGPPELAAPPGAGPLPAELGGVTYSSGGDEHGILRGVPAGMLGVGETVQLVPSHCDPTVNLHEAFVGLRGRTVERLFVIDARGPGW